LTQAGLGRLEIIYTVWKFLEPLPLPWRVHQVIRSLVYPIMGLLAHLPPPRSPADPVVLLDMGCGHGVFLALAKRKRPDLELIGLDLSEEKVAGARMAFGASSIPVRELAVRDIADFSKQTVDAITILDVLYLVPLEKWGKILADCHACLRPGGRLILKEMDPSVRWKFALLHLEETLAVKILGLTLGSEFTFPTKDQVDSLLQDAGFAVQGVPIDRGYHVPHYLWIATKPTEVLPAHTEITRTA
jgi:cyclopropane fatty-acyl-phospholipid synthase-like methyltransferase